MSEMTILVTHNDLDGAACVILCQKIFTQNLFINITSYEEIFSTLETLQSQKNPYRLIVADLNIKPKTNEYELLKSLVNREACEEFIYADHHSKSFELTGRDTEHIFCNTNISAAEVLYYGLASLDYNEPSLNMSRFLRRVTAYDCWKKDSKYFDGGKNLSLMMNTVGFKSFCEREIIPDLSKNEKLFLREVKKQRKLRIRELTKRLTISDNLAIVRADYESTLCNEVSESLFSKNDNVDVLLFVDNQMISLRSRKGTGYAKLLATKLFNGGGHPEASGGKMPEHMKDYEWRYQEQILMDKMKGVLSL